MRDGGEEVSGLAPEGPALMPRAVARRELRRSAGDRWIGARRDPRVLSREIADRQIRIANLAEALGSKFEVTRQAEEVIAETTDAVLGTADSGAATARKLLRETRQLAGETVDRLGRDPLAGAVGLLGLGFRLPRRVAGSTLTRGYRVLERAAGTGTGNDDSGAA